MPESWKGEEEKRDGDGEREQNNAGIIVCVISMAARGRADTS